MAVIAAPRFAGVLPGAALDSGTRLILSGLREARSKAVALNRAVPLVLSGAADGFTIGVSGPGRALPKNLEITLFTATTEVSGSRQGAIRFFPDGSSTGGRLELSGKGGKRGIAVDWLTGRIRLEE